MADRCLRAFLGLFTGRQQLPHDGLDRPRGQCRHVRGLRAGLELRLAGARHRRIGVRIGLVLGIAELLGQLAKLGHAGEDRLVQMLRPRQDVADGQQSDGLRVVLRRDRVLDVEGGQFVKQTAATFVGRVQQRGQDAVALVEVSLPVT
ncbi:hypothetical protein SDC9_90143 [bioreactor metagenome]|uniref:Uncharacterized protein n=1 Tax=bioreactor metagenome TaxID=1076179 RepID=A0A644ZR57_9ZZZZ